MLEDVHMYNMNTIYWHVLCMGYNESIHEQTESHQLNASIYLQIQNFAPTDGNETNLLRICPDDVQKLGILFALF